MSRITKNKRRINPRYFLNETVEKNKGQLHEVLSADRFGEDGDHSSQAKLTGVAAADVPGKQIKMGDYLMVSAIIRGGVPMGRYRVYDQEMARDWAAQNKFPHVVGLHDHGYANEPGSWYYASPPKEFTDAVRSHGGEGYLLTLGEMESMGIKIKPEVHQMAKGSIEENFKRFLNENPYVQPTGGKGYVMPQDHARQAELEDLDTTGFLSDDEAAELEGIKADKDKVVTPDNEYMIAMIMKKRIMDQIAEDEKLNRKRSSISGFMAGTIALDLYARFKGSNMDVMMPYLKKHIENGKKTLGSLPRKHRSGVKEMLMALPDEVYKRFTEF